MYEHRKQPLLPWPIFLRRLAQHGGIALAIMLGSLLIGILGYHLLEDLDWVDALLNAAMLLGGMGPINSPHTIAGKLFASFYALYCGLVGIVIIGILITPVMHRVLHRFHLEGQDNQDTPARPETPAD
jgi:hypothetical protein